MKRCQAFTLFELLLALGLTALLTAALSLMIGQAARDRHAMQRQSHDPAWASATIELLEDDLRQARWWAGADDRLVLIGLGRDGLPARITYQWHQDDSSTAWTRRETALVADSLLQAKTEPSIVALQLTGIEVGPYRFGKLAHDAEGLIATGPLPGGSPTGTHQQTPNSQASLVIGGQRLPLRSLPDQVRLQTQYGDNAEHRLARKVVLR